MTDKLLERIQKEFPNDLIEVKTVLSDDTLTVFKQVFVNGEPARAGWNPEVVQNAVVIHDETDVEEIIAQALIKEIREWINGRNK